MRGKKGVLTNSYWFDRNTILCDGTYLEQRPDTQLRIRAFCPGIFAFLAEFRGVEKNRESVDELDDA